MNRTTAWLAALTVVLLIVCGYLYFELRRAQSERPYLSSDKKAIDLAITSYARDNGTSPNEISRARFPIVIRFGDVRCVSLHLRQGWLGSAKVYCFDMDYNRVSSVDTNKEEVIDTRPSSRGRD